MSNPAREHVVIFGHGRSGTTWLQALMNMSPDTHARNAIHQISGTPLAEWPKSVRPADEQAFLNAWRCAVDHASARVSELDPLPNRPKTFLRDWADYTRAYSHFMDKPLLRRMLSYFEPAFREHPLEFRPPRWLVRPRSFATVTLVLKFVQVPNWADQVLRKCPEARVVHIVRHPGGYLSSWARRWLAGQAADQVREANRERLEAVGHVHPDWAQRWGDPAAMSVEESELWYWRYAAEQIHGAGEGRDHYLPITFEALAAEPVEMTRRLYAFSGLPWRGELEPRIKALCADSERIANQWRDRLGDSDVALIDSILEDSPLRSWWTTGAATDMPATMSA